MFLLHIVFHMKICCWYTASVGFLYRQRLVPCAACGLRDFKECHSVWIMVHGVWIVVHGVIKSPCKSCHPFIWWHQSKEWKSQIYPLWHYLMRTVFAGNKRWLQYSAAFPYSGIFPIFFLQKAINNLYAVIWQSVITFMQIWFLRLRYSYKFTYM